MTTVSVKIATIAFMGGVAGAISVPAQQPSILVSPPSISAQQTQFQEIERPAPLPTSELAQDEFDLLMRAPLHEAFAEIPLTNPVPSPLIARKPPNDIEELPPEYQPEGDNVVWIPGYWFWDEERNDFIWISGVWRDTPAGQRWVPGYWAEEPNGVRWVTGFWQAVNRQELTYLPQPPAPIEIGPTMPAPSADYFYVPGCWIYNQNRYVWQPGYYSPYVEDFVWVPPTYIWTPGGCVFRPGYWDRPFDQRGTVFAPVYFRQPVYRAANYYYQPTCVINTGYGLLPHLFVRANCNYYYFGDWYADRYVRNDFRAWSSIGNFGFYRNQYDPLYSYYSSPFVRYQNLSLVGWARNQHSYCVQNVGYRPSLTFTINILNQRFNQNHDSGHDRDHDQFPRNQAFLANTLEREVNRVPSRSDDWKAKQFVKRNDQVVQHDKDKILLEHSIAKERHDLEQKFADHGREKRQQGMANGTLQQLKLPRDDVGAQNDAQRQQWDAEQTAKRAETAAKIRQKQQEALARDKARRDDPGGRKLTNQLDARAGVAERDQQQNVIDQRFSKSGLPNSKMQNDSGQSVDKQVLRREELNQNRTEQQQTLQAREAQRNVEKLREQQQRLPKNQETQARVLQQTEKQAAELAARKQLDLQQQQKIQQEAAARAQASRFDKNGRRLTNQLDGQARDSKRNEQQNLNNQGIKNKSGGNDNVLNNVGKSDKLTNQETQARVMQQNRQVEAERAARKQQDQLNDQMRKQQQQQQQQQQLLQKAEAERAARKQQDLQLQQQKQLELQQRRASEEAQSQRADQQRVQRQSDQQRQRDAERAQRESERQQKNQENSSGRKKK